MNEEMMEGEDDEAEGPAPAQDLHQSHLTRHPTRQVGLCDAAILGDIADSVLGDRSRRRSCGHTELNFRESNLQ